jgi:hypothetical protein
MRPRELRRAARLVAVALAIFAAACEDENPFSAIEPDVETGSSQIWELGLEGFPSGMDIPSGERFFVGPTTTLSDFGTFVLDSRTDGTLVFRGYSTLVSILSVVRTGIQDLGTRPFDSVTEVPESGYSSPSDSLGVPVLAGHTYALRISIAGQSVIPINYAKLHVLEVGQQLPGDPGSRFVRFQWAYQEQPLNRNVTVPEDGGL